MLKVKMMLMISKEEGGQRFVLAGFEIFLYCGRLSIKSCVLIFSVIYYEIKKIFLCVIYLQCKQASHSISIHAFTMMRI